MKFRVYKRENLNGSFLFATYFRTKKAMLEYTETHTLKDPVFEKKIGSTWYPIEVK